MKAIIIFLLVCCSLIHVYSNINPDNAFISNIDKLNLPKLYSQIDQSNNSINSIEKNDNDTICNEEGGKLKTISSNSISVGVLTWNMAEMKPKSQDCLFLEDLSNKSIVVVATQELENIRPRRNEGHRSVYWRETLKKHFGKRFICISTSKLGGIQMSLYVKKELASSIKDFISMEIACGVGNVLTNKGAVCIIIRMFGKSIAFINAHLAAQQNKVNERNKSYFRIFKKVVLNSPRKWMKRKLIPKFNDNNNEIKEKTIKHLKNGFELIFSDNNKIIPKKKKMHSKLKRTKNDNNDNNDNNKLWPFDGVVFMGDLNYRVDLPRFQLESLKNKLTRNNCIKKSNVYNNSNGIIIDQIVYNNNTQKTFNSIEELNRILKYDQLNREIKKKHIFNMFKEGEIRFLPTFKYDKRSNSFDSSSKARCPAWTDRVLYYNPPREKDSDNDLIELIKYYSIDSRHSDHRPVYAEFKFNF